MMKIEYLYDNRELVMEILKNWDYDKDRLELLNQFRISSNAVYPFWNNDKIQMLRFSPNKEKNPEIIKAEIDFLEHLRNEGVLVPEIILSNEKDSLVTLKTKWGDYSASVFSKVEGKRLDNIELTDDLIVDLGEELGKIHNSSQNYGVKDYRRSDHSKELKWMEEFLAKLPDENSAMDKLEKIKNGMNSFYKTNENYGLIHYDFELDNIFYNEENGLFSIIDFDDAHYHWYVVDIIKSAVNIAEERPERDEESVFNLLVEGYTRVRLLDQDLMNHVDIFKRYIQLHSYVKCIRSIEHVPEVKPDWMIHLLKQINNFIDGIKF